MVEVNLMATVLFWHGFANTSLSMSMRGRYKMDSRMEIGHLFFKNRRVRYARADKPVDPGSSVGTS